MDRLLLYGYLEELHEINRVALDSVVNDIIDEQGDPTNSIPLDTSVPELSFQIEPQGSVDIPSEPLLRPSSPPPSSPPAKSSSQPSSQSSDDSESRLAAVEQSMTDLTGAVREELALLRKALLAQRDASDDET